MRVITDGFNVYEFSELSEETKQKAIKKLSDINTNYEWWDGTCNEVETQGGKIESFDLDRNRSCVLKISKQHRRVCTRNN